MKRVFQEIVDAKDGDCLSACLASLLELPIEAVPKFARDEDGKMDMMGAARRWLAENHGLGLVNVAVEDTGDDEMMYDVIYPVLGGDAVIPCIVGGKSANIPGCFHAVVGELDGNVGMSFTMTHDPNPAGKGIVGRPQQFYFLVPLNPAVKRCLEGGQSAIGKGGYMAAGEDYETFILSS